MTTCTCFYNPESSGFEPHAQHSFRQGGGRRQGEMKAGDRCLRNPTHRTLLPNPSYFSPPSLPRSPSFCCRNTLYVRNLVAGSIWSLLMSNYVAMSKRFGKRCRSDHLGAMREIEKGRDSRWPDGDGMGGVGVLLAVELQGQRL